jgi:hypothetical protein
VETLTASNMYLMQFF